MKGSSNCENCINYVYNEDYECYECLFNLDEDEMVKFLRDAYSDCPHFSYNDEYKIVRKQI